MWAVLKRLNGSRCRLVGYGDLGDTSSIVLDGHPMTPSELGVARLRTYAEKSPWARSQEVRDQLHQNWHEWSVRQSKLLEEARLRDQATPTSEVGVT